jgi:BirA family biotin operon repressor/biotin-[acetyl-CoA-carboxylase] ligase
VTSIQHDSDLRLRLDGASHRLGPFADRIRYLAEVPSTNDVAATLANRGVPEGTTIVAGGQTAGRGRLGRTWHSPQGAGLYVSTVLRPKDSPAGRAPQILTLAAGVALAEGILRSTGLPVEIKWPNDLIVRQGSARSAGRKVAGILAEGHGSTFPFAFVILGFGINLRTTAYPPDLAGRATSVEAELDRAPDMALVLIESLAALAAMYARVISGELGTVLNRWNTLAPTSRGAAVAWSDNGRDRHGTTAGIDCDGALLVRSEGAIERVVAGPIDWI